MSTIENYQLVDLEEKNLELVLKWRNSEAVRSCMYTDHIITIKEHYVWFKKIKDDKDTIAKLLSFNEKPIGQVNFTQIDKKNNTCYWGFYIGDKNAQRGSGTALGILALEYMFEVKSIRKLCAEVLDFNIPSLHFHKKLGFTEEGRLVKHVLKNNHYIDVIPMGLFQENWLKEKKKLLDTFKGG